MDKLVYFTAFSKEDHKFLEHYVSPADESSLLKSIPIEYLGQVRAWLKPLGNFRIMFRGPRSGATRGYTRKENAWGFAVYEG